MGSIIQLQKLGVVITKFIPLKVADKIAGLIGLLLCYRLKEKRNYIKQNLLHIFSETRIESEQFNLYLKNTFINSALTMVDFFRLGFLSKEDIISSVKVFGIENLKQALNFKRGCVLLTLHIGNWDYAGSFIAALGLPMSALVEETDPDMLGLYTKHRERTGMKTFSISRAGYAFLHAIKNNRILAVLADRDIAKNGITVDFFSGKRNIPRGLAQIIIKRKLPIVFGYMVLNDQDKHRYLGIIEEPIIFRGTEDSFHKVLVSNFERIIRKYPDQWFVFHPEWLE
jgi:lauroyl/myristoyl acyltransferase